MRVWPLVAVFLLAGCAGPAPAGPGPATTTGAGDPMAAIAVTGTLTPFEGGFIANVSAFNGGDRMFAYGQAYCQGSPWTAMLAGPSGEDLVYRDPDNDRLGCPSVEGTFPPGTWINWTATEECGLYTVCDNVWDGRLWTDGTPGPAPPGTYTWTFRLPLVDGTTTQRPTDGPAPMRHARELVLRPTIE